MSTSRLAIVLIVLAAWTAPAGAVSLQSESIAVEIRARIDEFGGRASARLVPEGRSLVRALEALDAPDLRKGAWLVALAKALKKLDRRWDLFPEGLHAAVADTVDNTWLVFGDELEALDREVEELEGTRGLTAVEAALDKARDRIAKRTRPDSREVARMGKLMLRTWRALDTARARLERAKHRCRSTYPDLAFDLGGGTVTIAVDDGDPVVYPNGVVGLTAISPARTFLEVGNGSPTLGATGLPEISFFHEGRKFRGKGTYPIRRLPSPRPDDYVLTHAVAWYRLANEGALYRGLEGTLTIRTYNLRKRIIRGSFDVVVERTGSPFDELHLTGEFDLCGFDIESR